MIVKFDGTQLNCQTVIKAYDMVNNRFNLMLTVEDSHPDDKKYINLLRNSHMVTLVDAEGNTYEYKMISREAMYNVRYDDSDTTVSLSVPIKENV